MGLQPMLYLLEERLKLQEAQNSALLQKLNTISFTYDIQRKSNRNSIEPQLLCRML